MAALKPPKEDKWVNTVCYVCQNTCAIRAHVVDGVVVKLEGNPESPHDYGKMCGKGHAGLIDLYNPNRITKPLKRTNPEKGIGVDPGWVEITYEEALDIIVEKMAKIRKEDPRKLLIHMFDSQSNALF
ncbi:MAG: molybdopterin oxidoreductase, partial [Chloroflexota bacterium]